MSAELHGLVAALLDAPGAPAARSALIDLLMERDDPRAELLRVFPTVHAQPFVNDDHPRLYRRRPGRTGMRVFTILRLPLPYGKAPWLASAPLLGLAALDEILSWWARHPSRWLAAPARALAFRRHIAARELYACGLISKAWRDAALLTSVQVTAFADELWGESRAYAL